MRRLIRPALFWIARPGLLMALVAWAVSQTWQIEACTPVVAVVMSERGWLVVLHPRPQWRIEFERVVQDTADYSILYELPTEDLMEQGEPVGFSCGGFSCGGLTVLDFPLCSTVAFRHWLITSLAATFYLFLKLIYRRKPTMSRGFESDG